MMNIDKFTTKSQSIIAAAQFSATDKKHGNVQALHLLEALFTEDTSVLPFVLQQAEVNKDVLQKQLRPLLKGLPFLAISQKH